MEVADSCVVSSGYYLMVAELWVEITIPTKDDMGITPWKISGGDDHSFPSRKENKTKMHSQKHSFLLHYLVLPRRAAGQGQFPPLSPRSKLIVGQRGPLSPRLFWSACLPRAAAATPFVSRHGKLKLLGAQAKHWLRWNSQVFFSFFS